MTAGIGLSALAGSAASIALLHTFAPDHWMPFAALGRAQGWSRARLAGITVIAGLGHVGSSILLGALGLGAGFALDAIQWLQGHRGAIALYGLVGFGAAYALWGVWRARRWALAHPHRDGSMHAHAHDHEHEHEPEHGHLHGGLSARRITAWTVFLVFVLGPCEPLIPIMFAGWQYGWQGIVWPTVAFGVATIGTMLALTFLAHAGFRLVRLARWERYSHAISGATIAATGLLVLALGI